MSFQQHVEKLARDLGVELVYRHGGQKESYEGCFFKRGIKEPGIVQLYSDAFGVLNEDRGRLAVPSTIVPNPYKSPVNYLTCLHELGHAYHKHGGESYLTAVIRCETEAWIWAIRHARLTSKENYAYFPSFCLSTYVRDYGYLPDDLPIINKLDSLIPVRRAGKLNFYLTKDNALS